MSLPTKRRRWDFFRQRLLRRKYYLVRDYSFLASMVEPTQKIKGVSRDPDDDEILRCAISAVCLRVDFFREATNPFRAHF